MSMSNKNYKKQSSYNDPYYKPREKTSVEHIELVETEVYFNQPPKDKVLDVLDETNEVGLFCAKVIHDNFATVRGYIYKSITYTTVKKEELDRFNDFKKEQMNMSPCNEDDKCEDDNNDNRCHCEEVNCQDNFSKNAGMRMGRDNRNNCDYGQVDERRGGHNCEYYDDCCNPCDNKKDPCDDKKDSCDDKKDSCDNKKDSCDRRDEKDKKNDCDKKDNREGKKDKEDGKGCHEHKDDKGGKDKKGDKDEKGKHCEPDQIVIDGVIRHTTLCKAFEANIYLQGVTEGDELSIELSLDESANKRCMIMEDGRIVGLREVEVINITVSVEKC